MTSAYFNPLGNHLQYSAGNVTYTSVQQYTYHGPQCSVSCVPPMNTQKAAEGLWTASSPADANYYLLAAISPHLNIMHDNVLTQRQFTVQSHYNAITDLAQLALRSGDPHTYLTVQNFLRTYEDLVKHIWLYADEAQQLAEVAQFLSSKDYEASVFSSSQPLPLTQEEGMILLGMDQVAQYELNPYDPESNEMVNEQLLSGMQTIYQMAEASTQMPDAHEQHVRFLCMVGTAYKTIAISERMIAHQYLVPLNNMYDAIHEEMNSYVSKQRYQELQLMMDHTNSILERFESAPISSIVAEYLIVLRAKQTTLLSELSTCANMHRLLQSNLQRKDPTGPPRFPLKLENLAGRKALGSDRSQFQIITPCSPYAVYESKQVNPSSSQAGSSTIKSRRGAALSEADLLAVANELSQLV